MILRLDMRSICCVIILIFIASLSYSQKTKVDSLHGKWKLYHIITDAAPYKPKQAYFLYFYKHNIVFDRDVNQCRTDSFLIDNNRITLFNVSCTEKCCDGNIEWIGEGLNYNEEYYFIDGSLYINDSDLFSAGCVYVFKKVGDL